MALSHSTQTYLLTLYVTYQQESAIRVLFSSNGWVFRKDGDDLQVRESVKDFTEETADEDRNIAAETGYRMNDDSDDFTAGKDISNNYYDDKEVDGRAVPQATETLLSATEKIKNETVTSSSDDLTDPDDDTDEYFPEKANNFGKTRPRRKSTKQAKLSKNIKLDQSYKKGSSRKKQSLVSVSQEEAKNKKHFNTALTKSGSDIKTEQKLPPCHISNLDLDIDADPDRTALEIELQETEDIDHYETVHKSLTPDEPFNPPSDVQETDGFSPCLGCYYCHDCGHTFQLQKWYKIHKWNGKCVYTCEVCSEIFTFRSISSYRTHMKNHNIDVPEPLYRNEEIRSATSERKNRGIGEFYCTMCDFYTTYKYNFTRHLDRHDKYQGQSMQCPICQRSLPAKPVFDRHVRTVHAQGTLCLHCNEQFPTQRGLNEHFYALMGGRYQCEQCHKSFSRKARYVRHLDKHGKATV